MIDSSFTSHAKVRLQQRAIPQFVVELLEQFGRSERSGGADRLFFDKKAIKRMKIHFGGARGLRVIEQWLRVYAVISDDGKVLTVAHSHRH